MELEHSHPINKSPLLAPLFHLVYSNSDLKLTNKPKSEGYFTFPKPNHHFIDPELYAHAFEQIKALNLATAQKNGAPSATKNYYIRMLNAEQYCTKYDMKAIQYNCLHAPNPNSPLIPHFLPVYNDNDIATFFCVDENKKFYFYPEPVNFSIDLSRYKNTVLNILKINTTLAHERNLDNNNVIKPYICRILAHLDRTIYNFEIIRALYDKKNNLAQ